MVDTCVSGAYGAIRGGSSPPSGTILFLWYYQFMTKINESIDESWINALDKDIINLMQEKLNCINAERKNIEILPLEGENSGIYYALKITPFDKVKVLIIGQDPYPNKDDAHGLAFSKKSGKLPASLKNIFEKIKEDTGIVNTNGNLTNWARQGVLLLNRALTYTKSESLTKRNKYWEPVIKNITEKLINRNKPLIIILWGNPANDIEEFSFDREEIYKQKKVYILRSSHPSNMGNAKNTDLKDGKIKAFMKSSTFSKTNEILSSLNEFPINWQT